MDYFALFGFSAALQIDTKELLQRYYQLQQQFHPDCFVNASKQERYLAIQKSVQINDGYNILNNLILRAEHLLALQGIETVNEQHTIVDTEFLIQQIKLREQLSKASKQQDPKASLAAIYANSLKQQQAYENQLASALTEGAKKHALDLLNKLKFYAKFNKNLQQQVNS